MLLIVPSITLAAIVLLSTAPLSFADVLGNPRDQSIASFAITQALEREHSGVRIPWSNPATGRKGTIVLEPATYADPDRPCRDYRRTIEQPGFTPAELHGRGCRIGPAVWTVDETMLAAAVAVATPEAEKSAAVPAPPLSAKALPANVGPGRPTALPAASAAGPALPTYTLPSKARS